ncbi:MAG: PAS domain S-box protein [Acidobacteriota bacterium]
MFFKPRKHEVLGVVAAYAVGAALWIAFTDPLLARLVSDPSWLLMANAAKGWLFVGLTALLLWFWLARMIRLHDEAIQHERDLAEGLLQRSEHQYRMLFDANPQPMWLYDFDTLRFLAVNDAAVSAYGYSRDEFMSMTIADIRPADEAKRLATYLSDQGGGMSAHLQSMGVWQHRRKSGELFDVDVSGNDLLLGGRIARLILARDITRESRAAQALLQSQQALSELTQRLLKQEQDATRRIAQALHDQLGQTLVVSKLLVDAAASDVKDAAPKGALERAASQLDTATKWVRQMLMELRPPLLEDKGLVAAIQSEVGLVHGATGGLGITVETDEATAALRWPCEVEYAVFMIVKEALTNAMQHAKATHIRVRIEGEPHRVMVTVTDDGVGLPDGAAMTRPGHLGLVGMRERATQLGAELSIGKNPSGGTHVVLTWQEGV